MAKKSSSKTTQPGLQNPAVASWEMPKKSSSKPPKSVPKKPAIAKEKSSSKPQTFGQEIEDIFSKKRKKADASGKPSNSDIRTGKIVKEDASVERKRKRSKSGGSNVDMFESEKPARRPKRKTADGLVIYSEEELGLGKAEAGGTRLCPFDCDCCF